MKTWKTLAALAFAAAAGTALGSLAVPVSVEHLARTSDAVVRGKVESVTSKKTADGRRIVTYAEIVPTGVWRGTAPAKVTVVVPGGEVDGMGQRTFGAPTFTKGEDVVVFLFRPKDGAYRVNGLAQGKMRVSDDEARPDLSGFDFAKGPALRAGERRSEAMTVRELERRVRAAK